MAAGCCLCTRESIGVYYNNLVIFVLLRFGIGVNFRSKYTNVAQKTIGTHANKIIL